MNTRETVEELLRRIATGDPRSIAEMYADEIAWMTVAGGLISRHHVYEDSLAAAMAFSAG